MNRREFSIHTLGAVGLSAGLPGLALAQGGPVEGTHYVRLPQAAPVSAPAGKVEVVEFFWYGCPSCAAFEGQIQAWADKQPPDEVAFVRLPASWHPQMSLHQRLYFTLAMLNKLELHPAVFTAIHNKHQSLKTAAAIEKWAVTQNIPATVWHKAFNSPQVTAQVAGAQAAFTRFQLDFTPAIVFNGEKAVAFTPDTLTRLDELIKATQEKSKAEPITPTVSP